MVYVCVFITKRVKVRVGRFYGVLEHKGLTCLRVYTYAYTCTCVCSNICVSREYNVFLCDNVYASVQSVCLIMACIWFLASSLALLVTYKLPQPLQYGSLSNRI